MDFARVLVQLDSDSHASVFDALVAIDSGVDHLLQYANIEPNVVRGMVHGAIFTRGPRDLKNTALFVGGSRVAEGEAIFEAVRQAFFGPMRCSVMFDGNGSNTTASAAVLCAARHVQLVGSKCLVLGGTGPVGQRVARLLLRQGASVHLASRDATKAEEACDRLRNSLAGESNIELVAVSTDQAANFAAALQSSSILISCGAAGAQLVDAQQLSASRNLRVAIDLNAVAPAGIEGVGAMDKAVEREGRFDYGAIGVGGLKMKIHRQAIHSLFTRNDLVLDAEEIFAIGQALMEAG